MHFSVKVLTSFSTLNLLFVAICVHSERDDSCSAVFTEACELKWSKRKQAFVASKSAADALPWTISSLSPQIEQEKVEYKNKNIICIDAPYDHHVVLHFFIDSFEKKLNPQKTDCGDASLSKCNSGCVAIYRALDRSAARSESANSNETAITFDLNENGTSTNSTNSREQIDRFPRHSLESAKKESRKPDNFSAKVNQTGHGVHETDKCKKKVRRRRRKHKSSKRKAQKSQNKELIKLFLEYYYKLLMQSETKAIDQRGVAAYPSKSLMKSSRGFSLEALRERIERVVHPGKRRRQTQLKKVGRDIDSRENTPLKSAQPADKELRTGRGKRQVETSAYSHVKSPLTIAFCGLEPPNNDSGRGAKIDSSAFSAGPPKGTDVKVTFFTATILKSREDPLSIRSVGRIMRVEVVHNEGSYEPMLQHLLVKVTFKANYGQMDKDNISRNREEAQPTPSSADDFVDGTVSTFDENSDGSAAANDAITSIVVGVAVGSLLIVLMTGIFTFVIWNRRRGGKGRQKDLDNHAEREKCLSGAKNWETRPLFTCLGKRVKRRSDLQEIVGKRRKFRMIEHENLKCTRALGKERRRKGLTAGDTRHSQHQQPKLSECRHLHTSGGSSRHVHCIVCQIAEKPHQPIMNAQYASEFLPPASRQNSKDYNDTLENSRHNFDKFNRMQNNPYRHSPSLPSINPSLPWTVKLPDGEELYRSKGYHQDSKQDAVCTFGDQDSVCVRPPPNRTIFGSEALPFEEKNLHRKSGSNAIDCPGPPTSSSKPIGHPTYVDSCLTASSRDANYRDIPTTSDDDCLCKYIISHVDEPPPEYSDVMRDGPPDHEKSQEKE